MITINNQQVFITIGGTRLVQKIHHITGKQFQSDDEAFTWVLESGWFKRYKDELIQLLHQSAMAEIYRSAPLHKQINAALGIYDARQTQDIKEVIVSVRDKTAQQEAIINEATTLTELTKIAYDLSHSSMRLTK